MKPFRNRDHGDANQGETVITETQIKGETVITETQIKGETVITEKE
jgi:hypothetical protein